jgi:hypothetical protein
MPPSQNKPKKKVVAIEKAISLPPEQSSGGDAALALFHPITAKWFRAVFEGPTAPQVAGDRPWRVDADTRADWYGEDADCVSLVSRQADAADCAGCGARMQSCVSFASEGAGG